MAWSDYNQSMMNNITGTSSRMADRAFSGKEASKGRLFGTVKDLLDRMATERQQEEQRGFLADESQKERDFRKEGAAAEMGFRAGESTKGELFKIASDYRRAGVDEESAKIMAAAKLASEDRAYGEGFQQAKTLKQMEIDARQAAMRLEAILNKSDDEDFNLIEAYNNAMIYVMGGEWGGPKWSPEAWTEKDKADAISRVNTVLAQYTGGNAKLVRDMVEADIMGYALTEASIDDAAEGGGAGLDEWGFPIKDPSFYALNVESPEYVPTGEEKANPLYGVEGKDVGSANWNLMYQMLDRLSPADKEDPQIRSYIADASDGKMEAGELTSFIEFLMSMGSLRPTPVNSPFYGLE